MNVAYSTRQRVMTAMQAWANRQGPITRAPAVAVEGASSRDLVDIEAGSEREKVADYIDALQTALVASQGLHAGNGVDVQGARLTSLIVNALQANPWHP